MPNRWDGFGRLENGNNEQSEEQKGVPIDKIKYERKQASILQKWMAVSIVVAGLFVFPSSRIEAAAVNVQTEGNATGVAPGSITVVVTQGLSGAPVSNLGSSIGDGTSPIALPAAWTLDLGLNQPAGCEFVPTQFTNWGKGVYTIRVSPESSGGSTCKIFAGDYHYVVRINAPFHNLKGSALGVFRITETFSVFDPSAFPDISSFASLPSDQFIINSEGISKVSRAHPYKGASTSCSHAGAHLHFTNDGAPYTVDIFAPADGVINRIDKCLDIGTSDRYGFTLAFARSGSNVISFEFSLEPMDGHPCSPGYGGNPDFFTPYILVSEGQEVSKGDLLGRLLKTNNGSDNTHIHFHLLKEGPYTFHCPNIFDAAITSTFGSLYGGETCSGSSMPATFCYCPDPGEDLTGLSICP